MQDKLRTGVQAQTPASDFIVVDFDGTLAAADIGNQFFHRFAQDENCWQEIIDDWNGERVTARQCLARECALARVEQTQALTFFDSFDLEEDAVDFVAAARLAGHEVTIASDGLELYVSRLLKRAGLDVRYSANGLRFEGEILMPEFASLGPDIPMPDGRLAQPREGAGPGCGSCGNCKGEILRRAKAESPDRRTILVGDGYSDRCAAQVADVVYAKDDLLSYCFDKRLTARAFTRLGDVAVAEGWQWPRDRVGGTAAPK